VSVAAAIAAPLHELTVAEASREVALGRLSPIELVDAYLDRIAEVDSRLKSFIRVDTEGARRAARHAADELNAGRRRGPLHGLPFAVKDNYDVAGLPTTANSRLRLDHVAGRDATLVARLKAAGAICLGKLSTWEYGTGNGGEYEDLPFPTTRNAWDLTRFAGGSSTGVGAAVAAGTVMFGLGSDTTGSVRLPVASAVTGSCRTAIRSMFRAHLPGRPRTRRSCSAPSPATTRPTP
jgi:aspartyl-tRNA(Asn)/glutamyl-tRNA(Gln) amidotransferase subunit A